MGCLGDRLRTCGGGVVVGGLSHFMSARRLRGGALSGVSVSDPDVGLLPDQSPEAVHEEAF